MSSAGADPQDDPRLKRALAWIRWVRTKREVIQRQGPRIQIAVGCLLLGIFYFTGQRQITLVRSGSRTQGRIVEYEKKYFERRHGSARHTSSAYMPIVEFRWGDRTVRFRDIKGSNSQSGIGQVVPVVFNEKDPSVALIDHRVWIWIPWAPMMGLGLFLLLVGIPGELRFRRKEWESRVRGTA